MIKKVLSGFVAFVAFVALFFVVFSASVSVIRADTITNPCAYPPVCDPPPSPIPNPSDICPDPSCVPTTPP